MAWIVGKYVKVTIDDGEETVTYGGFLSVHNAVCHPIEVQCANHGKRFIPGSTTVDLKLIQGVYPETKENEQV